VPFIRPEIAMPPFRIVLAFLIAAACALLTAPASAQITWDGGGDGISWSDRFNWSGDTLPSSTSDVIVGPGTAIRSASPVTVRSLALDRPLTLTSLFTVSGGGLTINPGVVVTLGMFNSTGTLRFSGAAQTISGSGTIEIALGRIDTSGSGSTTIGDNITVHAGSNGSNVYPIAPTASNRIINRGTIRVGNLGRFFELDLTNLTNLGTFAASDGGQLIISGTFNAAEIGTVSRTNGGVIRFTSATINGGTLTASDGLPYAIGSGVTLSGVTLDASITSTTTLTVTNGLTVNAGVLVTIGDTNNTSGTLRFSGGAQTIGGSGTIEIAWGTIDTSGSGSTTIGDNITVRTRSTGSVWGYFISPTVSNPIINRGTIRSEGNGRNLNLNLTNLTNLGTVAASNGGQISFSGTFNAAEIGTVSRTTGGVIRITSATINGGTLTALDGLPYTIGSGVTLSGVTLDASITSATTLTVTNGLTINAGVLVTMGDTFCCPGILRFSGAAQAISGSGIIEIAWGGIDTSGIGSTTIGDNITVRTRSTGSFFVYSISPTASNPIRVLGTIDVAGSGRVLSISGNLLNYSAAGNTLIGGRWKVGPGATLRLPAGANIRTLGVSASISLDGPTASLFAGSGSVAALAELTSIDGGLELLSGRDFTANPVSGTFTNNGTLSLSPGSLFTVNGNFVQTASGTFASTINGTSANNIGALSATGSVTLAGAVQTNLASTFVPNACNSSFGILSAAGPISGTFSTQTFPGTQPPSAAAIAYTASTVTLVLSSWADIVSIGGLPPGDGLLTGDDFVAFINAFAAQESLADITGIGGPPNPPDGLITGDDFNAFVNSFASGCP
jgi:hypothetical protein